jgi:hypothetical protein
MTDTVTRVILETAQITLLVLVMMIAVDLVNVWTRGRIGEFLKRGKQWRQYVIASLVGVIPGCVGAFTNVSLYIHGMISFGALVGAMAAVSGDEAFVMLAMFPKTAVLLFGILTILGFFIGWLTDQLVRRWHISTRGNCGAELLHRDSEGFFHYITEHVWRHIVRKHLWKTVLWTFGALLAIEIGLQHWNLQATMAEYSFTMLFLGAVIGLIPESGPHLIIVTMYANGLVPFSVLLTSSIVQDGHGMLPMLGYSLMDSLKIKGFNLGFGLLTGLVVFATGW